MKTYKFYADPGHGWLAVKTVELLELAIITRISHYSYTRGATTYLEEDDDAALFFNAYRDKHGIDPKYTYEHTDKRSPIRSYDSYNTNKAVDFALRKISSSKVN
jgi:hypothetical protein